MASNNNMPEGVKTTLGWAVGLAAIALVFVITLILFGNLSGNSGIADGTTTITVTNETGVFLNETGYTLSGWNSSWSSITVTGAINATDEVAFLTTNVTVDQTTGVVTNSSAVVWDDVLLSYTYVYTYTTQNELNFENTITNYSASAVNTTAQFPTVGTILGVAILLAILIAVLVFAIRKMMGIASSSNGSVRDNGGFG